MSVKKEPFVYNMQPPPHNLPTPNTPTNEQTVARPYVCNQCNQAFSRTHNLKSHLTTHSSEKPFQCPTCNQYFRRQHDLKRHQKLHTGERPFKCDKCFRSFARLDALTRHQRSDGGTACNTVHNRKSVSRTTDTEPPPDRPLIPQINIPNPATKPYILSTNTLTSSPPSTSPTLTSSPTSMESKQLIFLPPLIKTNKSPPPFRSWSYPSSTSSPDVNITLPSLPHHASLQEKVKSLEMENNMLKQQVDKLSSYKARVHDLEVENNLLKSLIQERSIKRQCSEEDQPEDKKIRYE